MKEKVILIIILLMLSGCICPFKKSEICNDEKYGPVAIRLSEFSSQVVYYYRFKKQIIPPDFDEKKFINILRGLPQDQINQKDIDSMIASFEIKVHTINDGFSVMLCEENGRKIMEDFANFRNSELRFDLNNVEVKSWNKDMPCSFEMNWKQYCEKPLK